MGIILSDKNLSKALYKSFKTNPFNEKLSFAEYAGGVGKILKGNIEEKLESMYILCIFFCKKNI